MARVVPTDRDAAKAHVLARLQKAGGLWLHVRTLGVDAELLGELAADYSLDVRVSPVDGETQIRVPS